MGVSGKRVARAKRERKAALLIHLEINSKPLCPTQVYSPQLTRLAELVTCPECRRMIGQTP